MVNEEEMGSNAGRHHSTVNKRLVAPSQKSHALWHMGSTELLMGIQLAWLSQAWEAVPLPLLCGELSKGTVSSLGNELFLSILFALPFLIFSTVY